MQNKIKVLHIDVDKSWRGGQQQSLYLHEYLSQSGYYSLMVCNHKSVMSNKCKDKNLNCEQVNYRNEFDIVTAVKIKKLIKQNKVNIVIAHSSHALSIGLIVKLFYRNIKLIGVRRVDFEIRKNLLSRLKYKTNLLDRIVCVSDYIKEVMNIDKRISSKLVTIRDCLNFERFKNQVSGKGLRNNHNIGTDDIVIGTVAAFVGHKDYPTLINAANIVISKYPNSVFICVGDGKLKQQMIELTMSCKIYDNFRFVGFTDDVISYLKIFDIFVLSSKMEGLGSSILEAQAVGLPVIATRTGGIPELVSHEKNGILVEPQNPKMLAEAILKLIESKEERIKIGNDAKRSVAENNIENYGRKYLELLKNLLDG